MTATLVDMMKTKPFSINVDGGIDNDLKKMYPLCVRIFHVNREKFVSDFLMCSSSSATAESIFSKFHETLTKHNIDWQRCVGFSVDNTSVNLGTTNSIMTRVLAKNESVYFLGCPCHIIHNCANHSSNALSKATKFYIGDLLCGYFLLA